MALQMTAHIGDKRSVPVDEQAPTSQLDIQSSVGRGGRNHRSDVKRIQEALNRVPHARGGSLTPLVVDGLNGPKTEGAIYKFQKHHFGAGRADGRVDPDQSTLEKLREFQTQNPSPAAGMTGGTSTLRSLTSTSKAKSAPVTIMTRVRNNTIVLGSVLSAKRRLAEAIVFVQGHKNKEFEEAEKLVNRCFKIRKAGSTNAQVLAMQRIDQLYSRMPKVLAERMTIFQPMSGSRCVTPMPKNAFAFVGGFHRPNTEVTTKGSPKIRVRGIYFCTAHIEKMPPHRVSDLIVHEMAHFVGPEAGKAGAIGHSAGGGLTALNAGHSQMIVTAANYAWLAWLARLPRSRWMTDKG